MDDLCVFGSLWKRKLRSGSFSVLYVRSWLLGGRYDSEKQLWGWRERKLKTKQHCKQWERVAKIVWRGRSRDRNRTSFIGGFDWGHVPINKR